jgi:hypothetical protein
MRKSTFYVLQEIREGAKNMSAYQHSQGIGSPRLSQALAALDSAERQGHASWENYEILRNAADAFDSIAKGKMQPAPELRPILPGMVARPARSTLWPWQRVRGVEQPRP